MKGFTRKFQKQAQPLRHKICFAIPCMGTIRIETMLSIIDIFSVTNQDFYFAYRTGCYIEQNRTELIRSAIENKCNKIFFLDADMMVEGGVINKLLAHQKPVVGAAYNARSVPLYSNVKMKDENGKFAAFSELPTGLFKADGVPTGCMLIDIPTIQKVPYPWFDLTYFEDGKLELGEDIYFCEKLHQYGIETWCDPTIKIGHIGTFIF